MPHPSPSRAAKQHPLPQSTAGSTMAAALTVLWLLAAFLGGAFSLTCFQCNTTGSNCEDNAKLCGTDSNTCMTTVTENRPEKNPAKSFTYLVNSCGEKKYCNKTYSMSFKDFSMYISIKCCDTEKCKTETPEISKTPAKAGNLKCPSCNEPDIKCTNPVDIQCIGEETKCVSYSVKQSFSSPITHLWKGCATESLCAMKNLTIMPKNYILVSPFQCSHGPLLLPSLLLTTILGLVMMKVLS